MSLNRDETFEREYFEKYYPNYFLQNPPKKMDYYRVLVEGVAGGLYRPRILDIGCAFGRFLSTLDPHWQRFGQDVSKYAIDQALRSIPDVSFSVSDGMEIPFDETFDIIASFDVLEHIQDLERVAHSVKAKLTPTGYFVFVVPVYDGPMGPLIRFLDKDVTHVHKKSRNDWLSWSGRHFQVVDWWGLFRYLFPLGYYLHWPTKRMRRFSPAIAVVSKKKEQT